MLILGRRSGEVIWIGDAYVRIKQVKGNTVKLAIEAPKDTLIMRGEIDDRPDPTVKPEYAPN